jgi:hypothetical protein
MAKRTSVLETVVFGGVGDSSAAVLKEAEQRGVRFIPLNMWGHVATAQAVGICCGAPVNGKVRVSFGTARSIREIAVADILAVCEVRNKYPALMGQWFRRW